jgi:transposase
MCMKRVEMDRLQELVRLHRMGSGKREVARLLEMSPNTEREYREAIEAAGLLAGAVENLPAIEVLKMAVEAHHPRRTPPQQVSSVEAWIDQVEKLRKTGLRPRAIYDRLRLEDEGFRESGATLSAVKRLWRRLRRAQGVRAEDVAIPVETRAGEVAQVDFGYVGRLYDPVQRVMRKAWVFVMVLGYSRHMVTRIVFDQTVETWLWLHVEAFEELGGVVEVVVPDNLKSAVIRAAFGISDGTALNRSYREFARHYGFKIDPTPVYDPRKKGKVESGVKYVKRNFFAGREESDAEVLRPALHRWVYEIAGMREHGTTGQRPIEVFRAVEQATLRPLPKVRFEPVVWKQATVHPDSHVVFERRLYSVPWRLIEQKVWVRASANTVVIYWNDDRVATHERRGPGHRSTLDEHLPAHRVDLRHRSRSYWEERADRLGSEVGQYVREVFDCDDVLSMLRTVQAVVTHLEKFPKERAQAACRRASFYGTYSYRGVKNILTDALDLEPLPVAAVPSGSPQESFRFARSATELLNRMEIPDEPN